MAVRGYVDAGVISWWSETCGSEDPSHGGKDLESYEAWLVGLRWNGATLEEREAQRTDGIFAGTARAQTEGEGRWDLPYDFVVDTVTLKPKQAASAVLDWFVARPTPQAIREIRLTSQRRSQPTRSAPPGP